MECKNIEDLIPGYSLDALEPEEALRVERHLETCSWCSVVVREQREAVAQLALAAESARPPGRVLKGLMKQIEALAPSDREGRQEAHIRADHICLRLGDHCSSPPGWRLCLHRQNL